MIVADTESQHVPGWRSSFSPCCSDEVAEAESLAYSQVDVEIWCSQVLCLHIYCSSFPCYYILLSWEKQTEALFSAPSLGWLAIDTSQYADLRFCSLNVHLFFFFFYLALAQALLPCLPRPDMTATPTNNCSCQTPDKLLNVHLRWKDFCPYKHPFIAVTFITRFWIALNIATRLLAATLNTAYHPVGCHKEFHF